MRLVQVHATQTLRQWDFSKPEEGSRLTCDSAFKAKENKLGREWRKEDYKRSVIHFNSVIEPLHMPGHLFFST